MNAFFRVGWLLFVLLWTAARPSAQNPVSENLLRADKQFDLYAYNLAIRTYESVLQVEPNNAHALARIADCYFQLNRPEESLAYYDRAVSQPRVDPEILLRFGKALMQTGDYISAKKWFLFYGEGNPVAGRNYADMCDYAMATARKEPAYKVKNELLNTGSDDYAPALLGARLVYNSSRSDIARKTTPKSNQDWTGSAYNQIFITQRNPQDGYLQRPDFLRSDLENNYNEGPVSFSANGRRVAYCRNNFIDGTRQIAEKGISMSLYIADVENSRWVNEKAFPFNGSDFATGFPCLSPDGNTLYFAANPSNSLGGWDIYVSYLSVAGWSAPRNLGAPLNTPGNEVTPFFDGKTLYFASDWHKGLGGLDIFQAVLNGDQVADIYHLGTGINSSRDDYGFMYDQAADYGYFTSNRPGGKGNTDIWQARKTLETFSLLVQDANRAPLPTADIDFSNCGAGVVQTDYAGVYRFAMAAGRPDCRVVVRKAGYQEQSLAISAAGEKNLVVTLTNAAPPGTTRTVPIAYATPPQSPPLTAAPPPPALYNNTPPVESGEYTLTVTDHTMQALGSVEVDLSSCSGGRYFTDAKGQARFILPASPLCTLFINKNGYESALLPVQPNAKRQVAIALRPIDAGLISAAPPRSSAVPPSFTPPPPTTVFTPRQIPPGDDRSPRAPQADGFAIQLAAEPRATQEEKIRQFANVNLRGNIYIREEGDWVKIRLGVYQTRKEAEAVLPEARRYANDAFIVKETGADISLIMGSEPVLPEPDSDVSIRRNPPAREAEAAENLGLYFAVQVASKPNNATLRMAEFDALSDYGNVYAKPDEGMMKIRVGVWNTYSEAEQIKKLIAARGYREALIITERAASSDMNGLLLTKK